MSIADPEASEEEHERMTACAEEVLKRLGLPIASAALERRYGFLCAEDLRSRSLATGADAYREISSCSNCGDFQARRMKARSRRAGGKGTRFVHR